jgi:ubiquinone/menaquinone biosynthesis C-methylase UbiE
MQQTEIAARQFGTAAADYLTSPIHAQGTDLQRLAGLIGPAPRARVLDLGCGAGHVSYAIAAHVGEVVAYDVSPDMLQIVRKTAGERGLANIQVRRGTAESLPFDDQCFDAVVSRLSAHHWRDIGSAIRQLRRVLKVSGTLVLIDSAGSADPLCDSHIQAIELLRDSSHVRSYSVEEWHRYLTETGFEVGSAVTWRVSIEFSSWTARMRTPEVRMAAIRHLWENAPEEVRAYYRVQADSGFELPVLQLSARVRA